MPLPSPVARAPSCCLWCWCWRQTLDCTFPVEEGPAGLRAALVRLCSEAEAAVLAGGYALVCLSDRGYGPGRAPVSSLLATGAVHHHLVQLKVGVCVGAGGGVM